MSIRKIPSSPESTHPAHIAQERKELRKVRQELGEENPLFQEHYAEDLKKANQEAGGFRIAEHGGLSGAKKALREQRGALEQSKSILDYETIFTEYPHLSGLLEQMEKVSELKAFRIKRMLEILDPDMSMVGKGRAERVLKDTVNILTAEQEKVDKEPFILKRQAELLRHKEELNETGHLCITPSVQKQLDAIGERLLTGKPIFLHGPTGTGKTSIARFAAHLFTGKSPEMVFCNPQTRESHVWGKTGVRPAKNGAIETVEIFGPLSKAMVEGKTVIFDEFTALPQEQMVFIKGILNAKVGDRVNVVGNGLVEIAQGFQMIFTANLKSEKNPERQELPPEIAREFEQNNVKVGYIPKDEAYTVMLSRMQNRDGSLDISDEDAVDTLPALCRAMADIQESYTAGTDPDRARLIGALGVNKKVASLKKFVLTQGTVEAVLSAWVIEKQLKENPGSFVAFLDNRLKISLLFEEYSKEDRVLAAKILASRGLLRTLKPTDLDLPANIFDLDVMKSLRGENMAEESKKQSMTIRHYSLEEVARLDPFEVRKAQLAAEADALLDGEGDSPIEEEPPAPPNPILVVLTDLDEQIRKSMEEVKEVNLHEALSILGPLLINPSEYKAAYGWDIPPSSIPPIPFTKETLEDAKKKGSYLILHIDKDPQTNAPITGQYLRDKVEPILVAQNEGKFINNPQSYEPFYIMETPRAGWVLVDKEVLNDSTFKNYTQQTKLLREYVKTLKDLTPQEQTAIDQCTDAELARLEALAVDTNTWKQAATELSSLPLNQLFRNRACETLQTIATLFLTRNERHLKDKWDWGISTWISGHLANVGDFDSRGAGLVDWSPGDAVGSTGVVPSRRVL